MRSLPDPGFAGDDGSAAPEVQEALRAYGEDPEMLSDPTLAVLQASRLLVPVVALLGELAVETTSDGRELASDKTSDMATVLLRGQDGRTALLAFTTVETLQRWDPAARPVPVTLRRAAQAAREDGAEAIVVDVAGPVMFVVDAQALHELAEGAVLARLSGGLSDRYAWVRPDP